MIKLIGIDIDGTLLDDNRYLSDKTAEALSWANSKGALIVLASGRPYTKTIDEFYQKMGITKGYYVAYNGEAIYDIKTKKCIYQNSITKSDIDYFNPIVLNTLKDNNLLDETSLYVYQDNIDSNYNTIIKALSINEYTRIEELNNHIIIKKVSTLSDILIAHKFMLGLNPKYVMDIYHQLFNKLNDKYTITTSMACFVEVLKKNIDKYDALLKICEIDSIKSNEIMGIGDSINDLSMVSNSAIGIAMGNSKQEVKDKASFVTKTNNESGIYFAIEKYKDLF